MTEKQMVIEPSAGELLNGAGTELIDLSKRVTRAEKAANRQTARARELRRQVRENEASAELAAENARLRSQQSDYIAVIGVFRNGDTALGERLAAILAPTAARYAEVVSHDPDRLAEAMRERAELRNRYVYDSHGHRVRADQLDANNCCPRCRREDRKLAKTVRAS